MTAQDQPLQPSALPTEQPLRQTDADHLPAQRPVTNAEVYAAVLTLGPLAIHQLLYGGPGPLGRKDVAHEQ